MDFSVFEMGFQNCQSLWLYRLHLNFSKTFFIVFSTIVSNKLMKIWQTIFANFFWYFNNVPNSFIVERNHWRCFILEFDLIRVSTFQCSLMQVWIKQKRSWNMLEKSYGSTYAIYYVFKSNELFFLLRIKCSVVHFTLSCSWF